MGEHAHPNTIVPRGRRGLSLSAIFNLAFLKMCLSIFIHCASASLDLLASSVPHLLVTKGMPRLTLSPQRHGQPCWKGN
jgi:hypothetical protein